MTEAKYWGVRGRDAGSAGVGRQKVHVGVPRGKCTHPTTLRIYRRTLRGPLRSFVVLELASRKQRAEWKSPLRLAPSPCFSVGCTVVSVVFIRHDQTPAAQCFLETDFEMITRQKEIKEH